MVGFKGIFNDMYARDISKKIRAGYKQKQKEGIVLIPPLGYFMRDSFGAVTAVQLWFAKRGVGKISHQDMNIPVTVTTATERKIAHRIP